MEISRKLSPLILAATAVSATVEGDTLVPFASLCAPPIVGALDGGTDAQSAALPVFVGARELRGKTAVIESMAGKGGKLGWNRDQFELLFNSLQHGMKPDAATVDSIKATFAPLLSGAEQSNARRGAATLEDKSIYANTLIQALIWEGFNDDEIKAAFEYVDLLSGFNPNYQSGLGATERSGLSGMLPGARVPLLKEIAARCAEQGCSEGFDKLSLPEKDLAAYLELVTRARAEAQKELPKGTTGEKYIEALVVNVARLERKIAEAAGVTEFLETEGSEGEIVPGIFSSLNRRNSSHNAILAKMRELVSGIGANHAKPPKSAK